MSNQLPQINVLIASYNYEEWVCGAIHSALQQTYPNIAITVVDSNSSDNSWKNIHDEFFAGKPHERVYPSNYDIKRTIVNGKTPLLAIKLDNAKGPSFARNVGIEYTLDPDNPNNPFGYVILDADDEMKPNKVDRMFREMSQLPNLIGVIYGDYDILNIETNTLQREHKETFSRDRILQNCIVHSGSLISTKALLAVKDENGYYDNKLMVAEDWDLWIRISSKFMILHVPESLSLVRTSRRNTTHSVPSSVWQESWQRVYDKSHGVIK